MSDDSLIDHKKLKTRYLVHYDSHQGPRFSSQVHNAPWQAQGDARGYIADGFPARVMRVSVGEDGVPVAEWIEWPPPGVYRVFWKTEGSSLAAIGMTNDGDRWLAPVNWLSPACPFSGWDNIERLEPVDTGEESQSER
jgi:hypothetical protein